MSRLTADKSIELLREAKCPLIDTHEALRTLAAGQVLEVVSHAPPSVIEAIPRYCSLRRCPIEVRQDGALWKLLITKEAGCDSPGLALGPRLEVLGASKTYAGKRGETVALEPTTLAAREGEFICLVGPSGCGKTTLLNLIAGLIPADGGAIHVDGLPVVGPGADRVVVFQEHALFPWLTVRKNVEFGLKVKGLARKEREERARELLRLVHLGRFEDSFVHELSGGMRQRVAIARGLAMDPKILLMDEPFAALDAQTRHILHIELQEIWLATRKTIIFVTHNVREAVSLADRIVVMSARPGRVKKEYRIDLPRPRRDTDMDVNQIAEDITNELRAEIEQLSREELEGTA